MKASSDGKFPLLVSESLDSMTINFLANQNLYKRKHYVGVEGESSANETVNLLAKTSMLTAYSVCVGTLALKFLAVHWC